MDEHLHIHFGDGQFKCLSILKNSYVVIVLCSLLCHLHNNTKCITVKKHVQLSKYHWSITKHIHTIKAKTVDRK